MRWEALEVIKSNTAYIHAKAYDFDATGLEMKLDYPKAAQILHDAGFDGNWSIEFEGKMNGILGALKTNELNKHSIAAATSPRALAAGGEHGSGSPLVAGAAPAGVGALGYAMERPARRGF